MVNVQRILCPVDFSEASRPAMEHAVAAARKWNAPITAVYVHSILAPWQPLPGIHGDVPVLPAPRPDELAEKVRAFYPGTGSGVRVEIVLKTGSPAPEIVQLASDIHADLLVIGTHGRGGFDRVVLGSVANRVLRTTRVPVLTVSPNTRVAEAGSSPYGTILCGVDFSDASLKALQYAFAFATAATKVILLHVVEGVAGLPRETAHFHLPEYGALLAQDAKTQLAAAVPRATRDSYAVDDHVIVGKAHREILHLATEAHADLIVMGVHGKGVTERWFGSTTSHVTRDADCPVLTVRADSAVVAGGNVSGAAPGAS